MSDDALVLTDAGLYCPAGDFHVDPWRAVDRAVLTHGHTDHARPGSRGYLAAAPGAGILRTRLGKDAAIETVPYGERVRRGRATVSLHPAGHVLGSAQVRVEVDGRTWVVSGDYATDPNPTCAPFEPVPCDVFVSECTFGLPVYRWPDAADTAREIDAWWSANRAVGRTSVLFAYALGKAQRVLSMVDASIGPILVHGALTAMNEAYREAGVTLPGTVHADPRSIRAARGTALVVAPPSAAGSPWLRRFRPLSTTFASGWMRVRGPRRRRAVDRGFVVSDHADWPGLLAAIEATGARRIGVTHGSTEVMARHLGELGYETTIYPTRFLAAPGAEDADADAAGDEGRDP